MLEPHEMRLLNDLIERIKKIEAKLDSLINERDWSFKPAPIAPLPSYQVGCTCMMMPSNYIGDWPCPVHNVRCNSTITIGEKT